MLLCSYYVQGTDVVALTTSESKWDIDPCPHEAYILLGWNRS